GSYVVNPFNGESVPLWIADYVLGSYGTGAVMAVPAHDERDFEFAKKYDLPIKNVVIYRGLSDGTPILTDGNKPFTNDGMVIETGIEGTFLMSQEARQIFSQKAETEGFGHKKVNYKLRDWLFSRQRYWGEPIPLIHITNEDCARLPREKGNGAYIENRGDTEFLMIDGIEFSEVYTGITGKLVIDSRLPVTLPEVERYEPAGDGLSPLSTVSDWVNVKLADNLGGKRETNTMPQWGGSCWYYLRYMDPHNSQTLASQEAVKYWGMVDEYVGGAEHAVLHLLYARFWHKVLYDIGIVPHAEPFQKLTNVGLILGPDGNKMSKSKGNVINPNDIVREYGADTIRLYEMSMSAFTDAAPWNPDAIIGVRRFLDKAYSTIIEDKNKAKDDMRAMKLLHKTVKKVGEDIVAYKFNTAISALQILLNEGIPTDDEFASEWSEKFSILLHPFAPHMAEELYNLLYKGGAGIAEDLVSEKSEQNTQSSSKLQGVSLQKELPKSIYNAEWPSYDEWMLIDDEVTIAIQINGKLRGTYTGLNGVMQDEVSAYAHETSEIFKWLDNKVVMKEIFIPNKMLSIVVRDA
ncbi:class I tRNA ligase family protein, partial [Candidatus Gracilibacteria bacterium]|nr:class I tRNA ligase family protein [Candidatus Gracilibacteria bacterium]